MKKLLSWLAALTLLTALTVPAWAAEPQLDYVTDAAWLLTDEEWMALEDTAQSISQKYQCDVYIITVDDFTDYVNTDSIYEAAKAIYRDYDLGYGTEKSGVLLMLSMAERDYTLIAYGYGNTAFTDYGKDKLAEKFLDNFGDDDWYGGFQDYLEKSADMLQSARAGQPLDVGSSPLIRLVGLLISVALGCFVSLTICAFLWQRMKSVAVKAEADSYIPAGSVDITVREDHFTHTTETRVKIEKDSSSGGGTSVDSDGFSGKSGKF
ncbi:MAG: TPM domain-containing protein [Oscillospiraceae bacterium]